MLEDSRDYAAPSLLVEKFSTGKTGYSQFPRLLTPDARVPRYGYSRFPRILNPDARVPRYRTQICNIVLVASAIQLLVSGRAFVVTSSSIKFKILPNVAQERFLNLK